ncbi:amidohydrolase family protein [Flindersiella endophytica]
MSPDTDVLVSDGVIAAVGPSLDAPEGATVVDAADRIVLPGFVDTHRHTWQTPIRMVAPDTTLAEYMRGVVGSLGRKYRPDDTRLANFAGGLECLNSGITTLVDWAPFGQEHLAAAVEGLVRAGIRGFVGCEGKYVGEFPTSASDLLQPAVGGLGPEYAERADVRADWEAARAADALLMMHVGGRDAESAQRGLDLLRELDLFGPKALYVHANAYDDKAFRQIAESGGSVSVTPMIEAAMGHGYPVTGRALAAGAPVGLGIDVVTSGPGDMFSQLRAAYALERVRGNAFTTADALQVATIGGARAVGLEDRIGSLSVGKQADIVLLRTNSLLTSATHDPVSTIVLSADTSTVDTVLVAGRIVKQDGAFPSHDVPALAADLADLGRRLT